MEIGVRIKQLRQQRGLTQEELAARTELTKGFISQLERDSGSAVGFWRTGVPSSVSPAPNSGLSPERV